MRRIGEILCPHLHPIPRNSIILKEGEGIGTKLEIECGMCRKKFKGKVERVREVFDG